MHLSINKILLYFRILPYDELMFVLDTFSKEYDNPAELSPFVRKQFVFLWAVSTMN